jgi:hypothetical protein
MPADRVGKLRVRLNQKTSPAKVTFQGVGVAMRPAIACAHLDKISISPARRRAFDDPSVLALLAKISPADADARGNSIDDALGGTNEPKALNKNRR